MQPQSVPQPIPKRSMMSSNMKQKFSDSLENQSDFSQTGSPDCMYDEEEPRVLTLNTKKSTNLGISLMGGNAVGIYVHDVQKNSLADLAGMKKGDQILEYNGVDLRRVTAEYAAMEISKPCDKVTVLVQHNMTSKILEQIFGYFRIRKRFAIIISTHCLFAFVQLSIFSLKSKKRIFRIFH